MPQGDQELKKCCGTGIWCTSIVTGSGYWCDCPLGTGNLQGRTILHAGEICVFDP
ncbi:MAG: hypothetical protein ABSE07_07485 [Methanoregula sp.]